MTISGTQRPTEQSVAASLVPWLQDMDWDVHQEVALHSGGRRADIVAKRGHILWVIEVKTRAGLALLDQAYRWLGFAHYVSVAAPRFPSVAFERCCRENGIGMLGLAPGEVSERLAPRLSRKVLHHYLDSALCDETRTWAAAGNALSEYYSPFRRTVRLVYEALEAAPGLTMRELVARLDHHYASVASARGALRHWIGVGKIPRIRGDGGRPERWYLKDESGSGVIR